MPTEFSTNKGRERFIAYAPLLIWIGVIFFLSSSFGSFGETSRFIGPLLHFLFPDAAPETLRVYHGVVRKAAHVGIYAVLAVLALRAFNFHSTYNVRRAFIFTLLLVLGTASIDETNQSLSTSRSGTPWDVLLDLGGGLLGLVLGLTLYRRVTKRTDHRLGGSAPE